MGTEALLFGDLETWRLGRAHQQMLSKAIPLEGTHVGNIWKHVSLVVRMELKGLCSLNRFYLESTTFLDTEFSQLDWLKSSRMNRWLGPWARPSFFLLPPLLGISLGNQSLHGLQAEMCNHCQPLYGKVCSAKNDTDLLCDSVLRHRSSFDIAIL